MMGEADEFQDTDPRLLGGEILNIDTKGTVSDLTSVNTTESGINRNDNNNEGSNDNRKQDTNSDEKNTSLLETRNSSSNSSNLGSNYSLTIHDPFYTNTEHNNTLEHESPTEGTVVSADPTHEEIGLPSFSGLDRTSQHLNDVPNMSSDVSDGRLFLNSGIGTIFDDHQRTRKKSKFAN